MRQTITFNDNRNLSKGRQSRQNIRLEILTTGLSGCRPSFTVNIADAPLAPEEPESNTVTITLEAETGKPDICTLPQDDHGEYAANWFDHIETVASDAPMEYSEEHFSVCDTLNDITANDNAFRILTNAMYSMSGIKMTKPLITMLKDRTLLELASTLGSTGGSDTGKKVPENAMQIINAELNKISKK